MIESVPFDVLNILSVGLHACCDVTTACHVADLVLFAVHEKQRDLFRAAVVFQLTVFQFLPRFKSIDCTACRNPVVYQRMVITRLYAVGMTQVGFMTSDPMVTDGAMRDRNFTAL